MVIITGIYSVSKWHVSECKYINKLLQYVKLCKQFG